MKELTESGGAEAVIALGLYAAARAASIKHEPADHGTTNGGNEEELHSTNALDGSASRIRHSRRCSLQTVNDCALDVHATASSTVFRSVLIYATHQTGG